MTIDNTVSLFTTNVLKIHPGLSIPELSQYHAQMVWEITVSPY